jgi:hypothetical protein
MKRILVVDLSIVYHFLAQSRKGSLLVIGFLE